jgi:cytokinin dehydrogenase
MKNRTLPRRTFLQGALAVSVVAFNPVSRSWAASDDGAEAVGIPPLDGQLLMDVATRTAAADDFGHIIQRIPWAVLVPGSVQDIVKMVHYARHHGLKVAGARGIGDSHSTHGQAQVEAGVVIDMSALSAIHSVGATSVWVEAGVRWRQLLEATLPLGKSPPTLTDFIELSIGGCLSVGGIGGQAFRSGLQVDNVLELDVVTGQGTLVRCSPTQHSSLFHAVRAGLGQFGIIVRACVRLVDVPPQVRVYTALYHNLATFLADQKQLIDDGRFDYVEGFIEPDGNGGWLWKLEVARYFHPGSPPNDAQLLAGLSYQAGSLDVHDSSYFDFANRLAPIVAFLESIGIWGLPHPWLNMYVPEAQVETFVQQVLAQTTEDELGGGPILLYPFHSHLVTAPFARMPSNQRVFLFALLRTAIPATQANVAALVAKNRLFTDQLTLAGGKRYPIDSVPMTSADWQAHFHPHWSDFQSAKALFDPDNVLTPGQGIF